MPAIYEIGQEIMIKPVGKQSLSLRDDALLPYAGQTCTISDYRWIAPPTGGMFYLYTLRVGSSNKEIVLFEDEITQVSKIKSRSLSTKGI